LKSTAERDRFVLGLVLITLIAAVPRLVLGASQFIEYDGYWHVFIAQQDNWQNFWADIQANAHPPLYFLLLKAVIHLGRSPLIYRSISLVTGIVSVFTVGWIARKVVKSHLWAWTAALAYGLAMPGIIVSNEVRSYMLSALFILVSFSCLLDLMTATRPGSNFRLRGGFAATAILACLSHYYAFFYSGVAVLLLLMWIGIRQYRGARISWRAEAATILPVPAVIAVQYETHAGRLAQIQAHLLPYYYNPAGHESISLFLSRNVKNLINLFFPYQISSNAAALVIFACAALACLALLVRFLRNRDAAGTGASWTILATAGMTIAIALSAVAGKYPFGGDLRQQFLLFPFFVLCAAILADRLTAAMPHGRRLALTAAVALAVAAVSIPRFEQYPKISQNVMSEPMKVFDKLEPAPAGVYLDQFNLITFFIYHHDWQWVSLQQQPIPGIEIYRISRGKRQMLVFRDKAEWNVKPDSTAVYYKLAECLRDSKVPEVSVFGALQTQSAPSLTHLQAVRHSIVHQAADSTVCTQRLIVNPFGWYATFRTSGCTATDLKPPRTSGTFDDTSDEIEYSGAWSQASFSTAAGRTLSFSNDPASSARLEFKGTEITWVFARAWNRGIASVKIDGAPRGEFDLYSPKIIWQSRTTFGDLPPGDHVFELALTGRKNAAATDRYTDIDALVVR
jgi:hypothetical protein